MKEVFSWIKMILIAAFVAWIINSFILININVPTESMVPTIEANDRMFAFRLSYVFSEPERGDIIVFDGTDEDKRLVKRLLGLPGETIEAKNGQVLIDGQVIDDYTSEITEDFGPYTIPESHYFMMGDNRDNSKDSRFYTNKFVPEENLIGKVFLKYYKGLKIY